MIDIEIIFIGVAILCFVAGAKALLDLRGIVRSMGSRTRRIIKKCDSMIAICDAAGKTKNRLIATKWGRK